MTATQSNSLKNLAKKFLTKHQIELLRDLYFGFLYPKDLREIAVKYGSDKWNRHWYAQHYQTHFSPLREKSLHLLEIGIGGYKNPKGGGSSLRMWRAYFPKAMIYGIDIFDKKIHEETRIKTFQGSQIDESFLEKLVEEMEYVDIIVDDGSHVNEHVIKSFEILFPILSDGGIYVVEDTQTSYWPKFGGSTDEINSPETIMGFFKKLADGLNYQEFSPQDHVPNYFEKNIVSIHFYHNMIFIYKGQNDPSSNFDEENLQVLRG
jgi:hypothetical protein